MAFLLWNLLLFIFGAPHKQKKNIEKNKKNILECSGNYQRLVDENQNIQDWKIWQCSFN